MIKEVIEPQFCFLCFYSFEDTHYFVNPSFPFLEITSPFNIQMAVMGTVML